MLGEFDPCSAGLGADGAVLAEQDTFGEMLAAFDAGGPAQEDALLFGADRRDELGNVDRVVLEVRVLDQNDAAPGLGEPRT